MRKLTPSKLRENIYKVLDQVALQGKVVQVERKGVILRIVPPEKKSRFAAFKKKNLIRGNPEDLVNLSWEKEWKPRYF